MKAARRTESCRARLTRLVRTRSRRSRLPRGRAARGRGPRGGIPPEEEARRERDAAELAMLRTRSEGGGVFTTGVVVPGAPWHRSGGRGCNGGVSRIGAEPAA